MIADRYYYNRLTSDEKEIYNYLYKGVMSLEKEIKIPGRILKEETVHRIFIAMTEDNPHLYYFNQTYLDFFATPFGSTLLPQYFCSEEQIKTYNERIQNCVNQILSTLDLQECSEYEKVKRVHDYMALNVVYDHEALRTNVVNRLVAAHSIIGIFAKQRAVCEGIAKAMKLLLNTVNVKCIVVSGTASLDQRGPHSWNIVKIDGHAYHLDVTWDVVNTRNDQINYDYFNLPDEAISADHFEYGDVPKCESWDANYFRFNHVYFKNVCDLERTVLKGLSHDVREFYFQMAHERHKMAEIVKSIRNFILTELTKKGISAGASASFNEEQRTGRILIKYLG